MQTSYTIATPEDFSAIMRSLRVEKNVTQAQLANQVGKTRRWVSDVERGVIAPTLPAVLAVMRILGYKMNFSAAVDEVGVDLIALALGE